MGKRLDDEVALSNGGSRWPVVTRSWWMIALEVAITVVAATGVVVLVGILAWLKWGRR
ncbi:MAG: hypothetical protein ACRD1X_12415 [Vicinamibacteria bacterium]